MKDKNKLRNKISSLRDKISNDDWTSLSEQINDKVKGLTPYKKADTALFFCSFRSEVNTIPLIKTALEEGKKVILPITDTSRGELIFSQLKDFEEELTEGTYGILEPKDEYIRPVDPEEFDFVLMPGMVFDKKGYRIGYGGGYYDKFLGCLSELPHLVAVAFDLQVIDGQVPYEDHDIPVDLIVTEERVINCEKNRK